MPRSLPNHVAPLPCRYVDSACHSVSRPSCIDQDVQEESYQNAAQTSFLSARHARGTDTLSQVVSIPRVDKRRNKVRGAGHCRLFSLFSVSSVAHLSAVVSQVKGRFTRVWGRR